MTSYEIGPDDRRQAAQVALNLISGCLADLDGPDLERFSGELFRETINNLSAKELIPRRRLHHRHGTRNIDLATAAIIAHDRATEQKPFRSVYEDRGMLVLGGD